jgi:hypothetical protein
MKRTQIYLTEKIDSNLSLDSKDLGITKSELIRRIMDVYYDKILKLVKKGEHI